MSLVGQKSSNGQREKIARVERLKREHDRFWAAEHARLAAQREGKKTSFFVRVRQWSNGNNREDMRAQAKRESQAREDKAYRAQQEAHGPAEVPRREAQKEAQRRAEAARKTAQQPPPKPQPKSQQPRSRASLTQAGLAYENTYQILSRQNDYERLGLKPGEANISEIRKAYRSQISKYAFRSSEESEASEGTARLKIVQLLNEAKTTLTDPGKRQR